MADLLTMLLGHARRDSHGGNTARLRHDQVDQRAAATLDLTFEHERGHWRFSGAQPGVRAPCVVFPEPVSPETMHTRFDAIKSTNSSRIAHAGSLRRTSSIARCAGEDALDRN